MADKSTRILLVEDNPGDARLVKEMLAETAGGSFAIEWVSTLSEALDCLARGGMDLVLLDLGLPDGQGLDTFLRAFEHGRHLPFLVLTGHDDEALGPTVVRQGAQDFLPKGEVTGSMLWRAIRYALERKRAEMALRQSESHYRLLFDTMLQGIIYHDSEGKVVSMNPAAIRILGKEPAEFLGETSGTEHHSLRKDGSPFPDSEHPSMVALRTCQEVRDVVMGVYNPREQGYRWLNVDAVPLIREPEKKPYQVHTVFEDITERKRAEEELQASERKLRLLATQLLTAQEDERKRISRELHDELGHALLTLKLDVRSIERQLLPEQQILYEEFESLLDYIDEVINNVRRLYLGLSPGDLEDLGITAALESLIAEFSQHHPGITWLIDIDNIDNLFLLNDQTRIYRNFQEILTNIGKYANPSHVSIRIKRENNKVVFFVEDDGKGFNSELLENDSSKGGMGLIAMEERARMMGGSFKIWSRENQGTRISFTIPIKGRT